MVIRNRTIACWVLWYINLSRLFNAKSFFIQIKFYFKEFSFALVHSLSKTFLPQAIQFSLTVLIQLIQLSININFLYTQLNVKIVPFQTIQFCIQKQFHFKQISLV